VGREQQPSRPHLHAPSRRRRVGSWSRTRIRVAAALATAQLPAAWVLATDSLAVGASQNPQPTSGLGPEKDLARKTALSAPLFSASPASSKPAHTQGSLEMARPRLELGTPRFSGTSNWCRKSRESPANRRVAGRARSVSIPVDCRSCPRLKDVAGPPRPFAGSVQAAAWGHTASVASRPAQAAPPRPNRLRRRAPLRACSWGAPSSAISLRSQLPTAPVHIGVEVLRAGLLDWRA